MAAFDGGLVQLIEDSCLGAAVLQIANLPDWCALQQTSKCAFAAVEAALPALQRARGGFDQQSADEAKEQMLNLCGNGDLTELWALMKTWADRIPLDEVRHEGNLETLLHIAAGTREHRQDQMLSWLASQPRAEVVAQKKNIRGQTALQLCARKNRAAGARILLKLQGAPVNARDNYESTALLDAVREEHPDLVALLLQHGADVNAFLANCHGHGETPLVLAVSLKNLEITKLLLKERSIDLHQKTIIDVPFGKEALDFATRPGPMRTALETAIAARALRKLHSEDDADASTQSPSSTARHLSEDDLSSAPQSPTATKPAQQEDHWGGYWGPWPPESSEGSQVATELQKGSEAGSKEVCTESQVASAWRKLGMKLSSWCC
mmetsp:Transcript_78589/g.139460  ORF Transcript_78589/g.139460 Transcript_78589/m.139460 type:complete len:380 (-) Transcript_78589:24-1163(-)